MRKKFKIFFDSNMSQDYPLKFWCNSDEYFERYSCFNFRILWLAEAFSRF